VGQVSVSVGATCRWWKSCGRRRELSDIRPVGAGQRLRRGRQGDGQKPSKGYGGANLSCAVHRNKHGARPPTGIRKRWSIRIGAGAPGRWTCARAGWPGVMLHEAVVMGWKRFNRSRLRLSG